MNIVRSSSEGGLTFAITVIVPGCIPTTGQVIMMVLVSREY